MLLDELLKFIKLIPENIVYECINSIDFINRSERRKYEKNKSLDSKIQFLLRNTSFRVGLIEKLYNIYKDDADSALVSYDDVLSSINSTNYMSKSLYMLHRCCDAEFDKQYFSKFIQSEPFQKTIKGEWQNSEFVTSKIVDSKNTFKENDMMTYYLGYIELRGTFYNFIPKYLYNDSSKTISEIPDDDLKNTFPVYGSLNLAYERSEKSHDFLKSLNVDSALDPKPCTSIYAIKLNEEELEDSGNDKVCKRLNLQNLCDHNEDLADRIIPVSKFEMFKIVTPKENIRNESFAGMIFINEKDYPAGEDVLLEYGDRKLVGSFKLQERAVDGEKYVRPDIVADKYLLECYEEANYELISFEKRLYMQNPIYTDIAYIKGTPHDIDVISDATLLNKLTDSVTIKQLYKDSEEFERLYSTSPFLKGISDKIRNERISRVQCILKDTATYDDTKKKTLNTLIDSLDDDFLENKIRGSKQYKKLQEDLADLLNKKAELNAKNEALKSENQTLQARLEESANSNTASINSEEIEKLRAENLKLQEQLSEVENYKELSEARTRLQNDYEHMKKLYDSKVIDVDEKNKELQNIKGQIQDYISDTFEEAGKTKKMLHAAFDPYISNAMIEAAGNYLVDAEAEQYKAIAKEFQDFECQKKDKDALIDMLVNEVQKFREYSKNEILNMFICLSQNFLTVFSGEPGTGKTSICNILANSLGLNNFGNSDNISKNRYIPVSVERGWSSKRDLIGYFNPLTKRYDRSNSKIYDGLMILNEEGKDSRFPYLILLDEANLSPMEYYWADFMRAADSSESDVLINIGLDKDIYIPKTLHFLATINNDQTTEQLSPRLLDRAWIIKLPKKSITETRSGIEDSFKEKGQVLWSDIENAFVFSNAKEMSLKTVAEDIYKLFDKHHLTISPRVQQSIKNYVCVAQEIMEDERDRGISKKAKALDFAIIQKLLPKINGYYKDYERLFTDLRQICDENKLVMTKEALITMEELQEQNMGYCQYLV